MLSLVFGCRVQTELGGSINLNFFGNSKEKDKVMGNTPENRKTTRKPFEEDHCNYGGNEVDSNDIVSVG